MGETTVINTNGFLRQYILKRFNINFVGPLHIIAPVKSSDNRLSKMLGLIAAEQLVNIQNVKLAA